jgi:hypothetical protein
MKRILSVSFISYIIVFNLSAQDEGKIVKRERIERDKGIFAGGGISLINDSYLKEYSTGVNFEGGYSKRLNRILSIGGSISYLSFAYDPKAYSQPLVNGNPVDNFYSGYNANGAHVGFIANLNNSKLTFISLSANVKVNFVPIKENTVISFYAFAKPFVSSAKHDDGNYSFIPFQDLNDTNNWSVIQVTDPLVKAQLSGIAKGESKFTGGIFLGPGIEINPTKSISFFLQASFGYTFASDFISTKSYPRDLTVLDDSKFPLKTIGFTTINFAGGISFNLD